MFEVGDALLLYPRRPRADDLELLMQKAVIDRLTVGVGGWVGGGGMHGGDSRIVRQRSMKWKKQTNKQTMQFEVF